MSDQPEQKSLQLELREKFDLIRAGGVVRRFHTWPIAFGCDPTVAAHSWGVALMVDLIYGGRPSVSVLRAALLHDVYESKTGDVPAIVKWANPAIEKTFRELEEKTAALTGTTVSLSSEEEFVLHCADKMDGLAFCNEQLELGNVKMIIVFYRWAHKLHGEVQKALDEKKFLVKTCYIIEILCMLINNFNKLTEPYPNFMSDAKKTEGPLKCLKLLE